MDSELLDQFDDWELRDDLREEGAPPSSAEVGVGAGGGCALTRCRSNARHQLADRDPPRAMPRRRTRARWRWRSRRSARARAATRAALAARRPTAPAAPSLGTSPAPSASTPSSWRSWPSSRVGVGGGWRGASGPTTRAGNSRRAAAAAPPFHPPPSACVCRLRPHVLCVLHPGVGAAQGGALVPPVQAALCALAHLPRARRHAAGETGRKW